MRENKFRGKRIDNGKWAEGQLFEHSDESDTGYSWCIADEPLWANDYSEIHGYYEVDPDTVGQSLQVNNGNEIYEGDIVSAYNAAYHNVYGVVKFGEIPDISGLLKNQGFYIEWQNDRINRWGRQWRSDIGFWLSEGRASIVGNIYDNPELLGGAEK